MRSARRGIRSIAAVTCLGAQLGATGCATLRELPRAEYAARAERKGVVVDTREGLHYRFDLARFGPDTLTGHHLRDTEGAFEEYHTVAIPLESVERLKVRRTDWWRSGLIAGGIVLAVVTAAVTRGQGSSAGQGPGPIEPPPVDP